MSYSQKLSRSLFVVLGMLAFVLYGIVVSIASVNWDAEFSASSSAFMRLYILASCWVFMPALVLVIFSMHVFIFVKDIYVNLIGLVVVSVLVVFHFVGQVMVAHGGSVESFFFQSAEVVVHVLVFTIFYFRYVRENKDGK